MGVKCTVPRSAQGRPRMFALLDSREGESWSFRGETLGGTQVHKVQGSAELWVD
jgi:hypothetical protein